MYKLKESLQDFNGKYNGSIGILTTKNPTNKEELSYPIYIDRIEAELEYIMLCFHSINSEGGEDKWVRNRVRMNQIIDLAFPIPNVGYITPKGCFPTYIDRRAIKNTNRGWSATSFNVKTPPVLTRIEKPSTDYKYVRTSVDAGLVKEWYAGFKYASVTDLRAGVAFAALSKDFLAVKYGNKYALVYQNNLIGNITMEDGKKPKVEISPKVGALYDVFTSQVGFV